MRLTVSLLFCLRKISAHIFFAEDFACKDDPCLSWKDGTVPAKMQMCASQYIPTASGTFVDGLRRQLAVEVGPNLFIAGDKYFKCSGVTFDLTAQPGTRDLG